MTQKTVLIVKFTLHSEGSCWVESVQFLLKISIMMNVIHWSNCRILNSWYTPISNSWTLETWRSFIWLLVKQIFTPDEQKWCNSWLLPLNLDLQARITSADSLIYKRLIMNLYTLKCHAYAYILLIHFSVKCYELISTSTFIGIFLRRCLFLLIWFLKVD